jgi:BON domain-containing protein
MDTRSMLIGAAAGSMIMFMLDPNGGRRSRAATRDRMTRAPRKTSGGDETLVARVRAKLGRAVSHPSAIEVTARDGHVILRGPILASEVPAVLGAVAAVQGVAAVSDTLEPHETTASMPSLQEAGGGGTSSVDALQRIWAPAMRSMVTAGVVATGAWVAMNLARGRNASEDRHGSL